MKNLAAALLLAAAPFQTASAQPLDNPPVCACCSCLDKSTAKVSVSNPSTDPAAAQFAESISWGGYRCLRVLEDAEGRLNFTVKLPVPLLNPPAECTALPAKPLSIKIRHEGIDREDSCGPFKLGQQVPIVLEKWKCGGRMWVEIYMLMAELSSWHFTKLSS